MVSKVEGALDQTSVMESRRICANGIKMEHKKIEEMKNLVEQVTKIPAPTFKENKRADFVKRWLEEKGIGGVIQDEAGNVILALDAEYTGRYVVVSAHLDTVFENEEITVQKEKNREGGEIWRALGIGDNSANVAVLMMAAWQLWQEKEERKKQKSRKVHYPFIFLWNVGEEGLGNLKGMRAFMKQHRDRVDKVIALDLYYDKLCTGAVGSKRYQVCVNTEGGHSYLDFGNANAIEILAGIIEELYRIPIQEKAMPQACEKDRSSMIHKTTFNVGMIEGGTSVNTIAQQASMLYEIRSDSAKHMQQIEKQAIDIWEKRNRTNSLGKQLEGQSCKVTWKLVGDRPCMGEVDQEKLRRLADSIQSIIKQKTGKKVPKVSISTDCNIPLSVGIPSVSFGVSVGGGAHTLQEWIDVDSLQTGYEILMEVLFQNR